MNDIVSEPAIRSHRADGVAWIVIDNPRRRNALTLDMMDGIAPLIADFEQSPDVRVVVITGSGGKAFSSGGDFSEFSRNRETAEGTEAYRERFRAAVSTVARASKPTIAAVEGHCVGGGLTLALACDLRYVTPDALFHIPSAEIGNGFHYGSVERLTALVGPSHAKEIFLTADRVSGEEAARIGLANRCLPKEGFLEAVTAIAARIASNAPLSLFALKRAVNAAAARAEGEDLKPVFEAFDRCAVSEDHKEGRLAKVEKRRPVFHGR